MNLWHKSFPFPVFPLYIEAGEDDIIESYFFSSGEQSNEKLRFNLSKFCNKKRKSYHNRRLLEKSVIFASVSLRRILKGKCTSTLQVKYSVGIDEVMCKGSIFLDQKYYLVATSQNN